MFEPFSFKQKKTKKVQKSTLYQKKCKKSKKNQNKIKQKSSLYQNIIF